MSRARESFAHEKFNLIPLVPPVDDDDWTLCQRQMNTFSKVEVTSVENRFVRTVCTARPPHSRREFRRFHSKAVSINLLPQMSPLFWEDFRADWRTWLQGGFWPTQKHQLSVALRAWLPFHFTNPHLSNVMREELQCSTTDWTQKA